MSRNSLWNQQFQQNISRGRYSCEDWPPYSGCDVGTASGWQVCWSTILIRHWPWILLCSFPLHTFLNHEFGNWTSGKEWWSWTLQLGILLHPLYTTQSVVHLFAFSNLFPSLVVYDFHFFAHLPSLLSTIATERTKRFPLTAFIWVY